LNKEDKLRVLSESYFEEDKGILSRNSMLKCYNLWATQAYPDFHALIDMHRKERRTLIQKPDKYIHCCERYYETLHTLLKKSFEDLWPKLSLHITVVKWKESFKNNFSNQDEDYEYEMMEAFLKNKLPSKHILTLLEQKEVFRKQIALAKFSDLSLWFTSYRRDNMKVPESFLIENYLFDRIHEFFGYEEEDYFLQVKRLTKTNEEAKKLYDEFVELINGIPLETPRHRHKRRASFTPLKGE